MGHKEERKNYGDVFMQGANYAYHKLYLEKAAKNETVVVMINHEIRHVPAKDLLPDQIRKLASKDSVIPLFREYAAQLGL